MGPMIRIGPRIERIGRVLGPLAAIGAVVYFGYHGVLGERGVLTWMALKQEIEHTRTAVAMSEAERDRLAHRVSLLRPESLDRDMLDERARLVLNMMHPDEVLVFDRERASR